MITEQERKKIISEIRNGKSLSEYDEEARKDIEIIFEAVLADEANEQYIDENISKIVIENPELLFGKISNNKDLIKRLIMSDIDIVEYLDDNVRKNPEIQEIMITSNPYNIKYASEEKKSDKELAKVLIGKAGSTIQYFNDDIKNDEELALMSLDNSYNFKYIGDSLKKDKEFLIKVIEKNYNCYKFFDDMREDAEIALFAIEKSQSNIDYVPQKLLNSVGFLESELEVDLNGELYKKLPQEIKMNKEITQKFIQRNPANIANAPKALLEDRDYIKEIILQNPKVFGFFPFDLKNDRELLILACREDLNNTKYIVSDEIKEIIENIASDSSLYKDITSELKNDLEMVKLFIQINPNVFKYVSEDLKNNEQIAIVAIDSDEKQIYYIGEELRENIEFAKEILLKHPRCYGEFSESVRNNKNLARMIVELDKNQLSCMGRELKDNMEFAKEILLKHPRCYSGFSENVRNNKNIARMVAELDKNQLSCIGRELKDNMEFAKEMISKTPSSYSAFSEKIKTNPEVLSLALKNGYYDAICSLPIEYRYDTKFEKDVLACLSNMIDINGIVKEDLINAGDIYLVALYQKNDKDLNEHLKSIFKNRVIERISQGEKKKISENDINNYVEKMLKNDLSVFYKPKSLFKKSLEYMNKIGDIKTSSDDNYICTMLEETILKTNIAHIEQIKQLLNKGKYLESSLSLAHKMYETIGFERSTHLLNGKYGEISRSQLESIFSGVDTLDVIFEPDGKKFKPVLNEEFINTFFGASYKVDNTPIKRYLNPTNEMELRNMTPESRAKEEKLKQNSREIFTKFGKIFSEWNIIEEEYIRMESNSKLKLKKNPETINKIVKYIESTKGSRVTEQDQELLNTDILNYISDTQFVSTEHKTPFQRALELSRNQEKCKKKKFPKIDIEGEFTKITVFHPQDREILTMGYKSGCCFRPCGNADNSGKNDKSLLAYCTSSEYAGGIKIEDKEGKILMFSPIIRSGNMLMVHSIETLGMTDEENTRVHESLIKWSEQMISESEVIEENDGIKAVVATDLHHLDMKYTKGTLTKRRFEIYDNGEFERI